MTAMAKRLLISLTIVVVLMASGGAAAAERTVRQHPRSQGISCYVMMILDMFSGRDIGAMISFHVRGDVAKPGGDPGAAIPIER